MMMRTHAALRPLSVAAAVSVVGGMAAAPATVEAAAEYESIAQVRVGDYINNQTTSLGTMTTAQTYDFGTAYVVNSPDNTSLWSGRAAAQTGPGYLRGFSEMQVLLGGSDGDFGPYGTVRAQGNQGTVDFSGNWGVGFIASSRSTIRDRITVNAPGLEGQEGRIEIAVAVSGNVYYSHGAQDVPQFIDLMQAISAQSWLAMNFHTYRPEGSGDEEEEGGPPLTRTTDFYEDHDFGVSSYFSFWEDEPNLVNEPRGGIARFSIPVVFGDTYDMELSLFTSASLGTIVMPTGMYSMRSDFHNTAVITGLDVFVQGEEEEEETSVGNASVLGEGSLSYLGGFTAPAAPPLPPFTEIPEPASAMMVLGLAGLLARRRSA